MGSTMRTNGPLHPHPRPSRCINRSKELELQRIERMSVEERIRLAIGLKERIANLLPHPAVSDNDAASVRPA